MDEGISGTSAPRLVTQFKEVFVHPLCMHLSIFSSEVLQGNMTAYYYSQHTIHITEMPLITPTLQHTLITLYYLF